MRIDFLKSVEHKSKGEIVWNGETFQALEGAWAAYIPQLDAKILHSFEGSLHCTHPSAPSRWKVINFWLGFKSKTYSVQEWRSAYKKPVLLRVAENYIAAKLLEQAGLRPKVHGIFVTDSYISYYGKGACVNGGIYIDNLNNYPEKQEATIPEIIRAGVQPDKILSCYREQVKGYVSDLNSVVGVMPIGKEKEIFEVYERMMNILYK